MAKTVNLKINGKDVKVDEGVNLIEAAAAAGVHIPNLCYLKGMKGIGACRLCLVELEGGKAPVIACNTKVKEGMSVLTETDKVKEVRKFVIDLILSMHPLDCMTCTKAGVCNLQQYAYDFEIKESSFSRKKFGYPTDEANPFIKRDPEYCVLCSRCVRICKSQGTNVLEFSGRGVGAKVVTGKDRPLQESNCTFCGSCIDVCPVNAILEADRWRKGREWDYCKVDSVCLSCGNGCDITVSTDSGAVVKINAREPETGGLEKYICAVGRFGFDSLTSDLRATVPMKRVNGELKETTWDDALAVVAKKMKEAKADAAFVSSGNILNEEAAMLQKLAADVAKTKRYGTSVSLYADAASMNAATADIENADLIVLAGLDPSQWSRVLPALDAIVRKKVDNGAKLIVINSGKPGIAAAAHLSITGDEVEVLKETAQALIAKGVKAPKEMVSALASVNPSDAAASAADLIGAAKAPVILTAPFCYAAGANLSLIRGEAVAVPFEANAKGIALMGLMNQDVNEILSAGEKFLYVVGEVPVSGRPKTDFLVVQTSYMNDLATQADIVLPAAAPLESDGTMVDYLGRLKNVRKAAEPQGQARANGEIFAAVAKEAGASLKPPKETEIKKALKAKAKVDFAPYKSGKKLSADQVRFTEEIRKSIVNGSRLLWLKEVEKTVAA